MKRYAIIHAAAADVVAYLPRGYEVAGEVRQDGRTVTIIEGRDDAGWTLNDYVLPRLASGLYFGEEIDLSHPAMKGLVI